MTPRTTTAKLASQPARRLWALGSVLLIGAAAAAFSATALAGGHRGHSGDHGSNGPHQGGDCMHEGHMGQMGHMARHGGKHAMGSTRHLDRLLGDAHKLTDAQRIVVKIGSSLVVDPKTRAPSAAKRCAIAAPIPRLAPVTIATLPRSRPEPG